MVKIRKLQLEERIKKLESFIFKVDIDEDLKKIYEDHIDFLREELKECSKNDK